MRLRQTLAEQMNAIECTSVSSAPNDRAQPRRINDMNANVELGRQSGVGRSDLVSLHCFYTVVKTIPKPTESRYR